MVRILVVHHDLTQITFFRNILSCQGYEAICASDYATAVDAVQHTRMQLAFFGGGLNGITGVDLAHSLRSLDATLPLVMLISLFDAHRSRLDALDVKSMICPFGPNKILKAAQLYIRTDADARLTPPR